MNGGGDDAFAESTIVLEVPARADFVSFVRVVVAAAAELEPDMAPERIEDLKLAVSEAATNAIDAQWEGEAPDLENIRARRGGRGRGGNGRGGNGRGGGGGGGGGRGRGGRGRRAKPAAKAD